MISHILNIVPNVQRNRFMSSQTDINCRKASLLKKHKIVWNCISSANFHYFPEKLGSLCKKTQGSHCPYLQKARNINAQSLKKESK